MSRRRRRQLANLGPDGWPVPLKWRPRVRVFGIISGMLGGLGTVVLIQLYGIAPLGRALTLQGLIGGALSGVIVPSLVFAVVVNRYNRKLDAARSAGSRSGGAYGAATTFLFIGVLGAMLTLGALPALATIDGPCDLTVNGIDVRTIELTREDAIPVVSENPVTGYIAAPSDFQAFEVVFYYAGFSYGFGDSEVEDDPDGGGGSGTFELPADLLFRYAGGLYEVRARGPLANGSYCEYAMLFDVDRNPLETPAGKAAAATAAVGAVGVLGVAAASVVEGTRMIGDLGTMLTELPTPPTVGKAPGGWSGTAAPPPPPVAPETPAVAPPEAPPPGTGKIPVASSSGAKAPSAAPVSETGAGRTATTPDAPVPEAGQGKTPASPVPGGKAPEAGEGKAPTDTPVETPPRPPVEEAGRVVTPGGGEGAGKTPAGVEAAAKADAGIPSSPAVGSPESVSGGDEGPSISTKGAGAGLETPVAQPGAGGKGSSGPTGVEAPSPGAQEGVAAATPGVLGAAAGSLDGAAGPPTSAGFWFYVDEATQLFGDQHDVIGHLSPGTWYLAGGASGEWVRVADVDAGLEGWVLDAAVRRPTE